MQNEEPKILQGAEVIPSARGSENALAEQYSQIEINGADLAIGYGQPMVLVHANISDMPSWEPIQSKPAQHFRVITYSRRYAWPNEPIPGGADDPWSVHADDLGVLIKKLDIAPAHVIGSSTGAFVALLLPRDKPELLVLEGPPVVSIFLPSTPPTLWQLLTLLFWQPATFLPVVMFGATVAGPIRAAIVRGDDKKALEIFGRGALGEGAFARLSATRIQQMRDNMKPHAVFCLTNGLPLLSEADARNILVPTLMLSGEKTTIVNQHINRRLAALIPAAKEAVGSKAAHLVHEDHPDGVLEAVLRFIVE